MPETGAECGQSRDRAAKQPRTERADAHDPGFGALSACLGVALADTPVPALSRSLQGQRALALKPLSMLIQVFIGKNRGNSGPRGLGSDRANLRIHKMD